jgi:thymidylate kinase
MIHKPLAVGLEGPCCAGKTTLARALLTELSGLSVGYVKCYSDHVGGGRFLPRPVPESAAEDRYSLEALIAIEADRKALPRGQAKDVLLIDRSIHTLLAHRYALDRMMKLGLFPYAKHLLEQSNIPIWPNPVIYLDIPQELVRQRGKNKFPPNSIYTNAEFNTGIRSYFCHLAEQTEPKTIWLEAKQDQSKVLQLATAHLKTLILRGSL